MTRSSARAVGTELSAAARVAAAIVLLRCPGAYPDRPARLQRRRDLL